MFLTIKIVWFTSIDNYTKDDESEAMLRSGSFIDGFAYDVIKVKIMQIKSNWSQILL